MCFLVIKLEQLKAAVVFQRPVQVPHTVVDFGNNRVVGQALTAGPKQQILCANISFEIASKGDKEGKKVK